MAWIQPGQRKRYDHHQYADRNPTTNHLKPGRDQKASGYCIKNEGAGEIVYTPPAGEQEILKLLTNLEAYINSDNDLDPLVKLAVVHYQFEAIHPFCDGNSRTGRILNILYLVSSC